MSLYTQLWEEIYWYIGFYQQSVFAQTCKAFRQVVRHLEMTKRLQYRCLKMCYTEESNLTCLHTILRDTKIQDGLCLHFDSEGSVSRVHEYCKGLREGNDKGFWTRKGRPHVRQCRYTTSYRNGMRHGVAKWWTLHNASEYFTEVYAFGFPIQVKFTDTWITDQIFWTRIAEGWKQLLNEHGSFIEQKQDPDRDKAYRLLLKEFLEKNRHLNPNIIDVFLSYLPDTMPSCIRVCEKSLLSQIQ